MGPSEISDFAVTDWRSGGHPAYLRLFITCGPMEAEVAIDSRTAREIALDVLARQAQYLMYQPPNDSMKERSERAGGWPITANSDRLARKRKRWPVRGERPVDRAAAVLGSVLGHGAEPELARALDDAGLLIGGDD